MSRQRGGEVSGGRRGMEQGNARRYPVLPAPAISSIAAATVVSVGFKVVES